MAINSVMAAARSLPGLNIGGHRESASSGSTNKSSADPASDGSPLASNQHLFSHLLNSTEEMVGLNPAAASREP